MESKMELTEKILHIIEDFPTLPTIYSALSDLMANPHSTQREITELIMTDQAAAAKVLKFANSAIFGFSTRIESISQAVFFLGFEEIKNLVVALKIIDLFRKSKISNHFNPVEFWKHSIAVGVITRAIGNYMGTKDLDNYFLAGILHDIGKLFFIKYMENEYVEVLNYSADNGISIIEAEQRILGVTHCRSGEIIADKWKLPQTVQNAIKYHTTGLITGQAEELPAVVHIANITARVLELGFPGDRLIHQPNLKVWEYLSPPDNMFSNIYSKILYDYNNSLQIFLLK